MTLSPGLWTNHISGFCEWKGPPWTYPPLGPRGRGGGGGPAEDERGGCAPEVMRLRDHVGNLIEGAADEVHELEFGDGTHAGERCSEGRAHDCGLGDRRIDDALGAEAVDETISDFKSPAVDANVFAEA